MKHFALSLSLALASLAAAPLASAQSMPGAYATTSTRTVVVAQPRAVARPVAVVQPAVAVNPVFVAPSRDNVREARQEERIRQGAYRGELSPREQMMVQRGQARIDQLQLAARADGVITRREARQIEQAQNEQNALIRRLRNNQRGYSYGRGR